MSSFIQNDTNKPFQSKVVVDEKGKQVAENYSGRKFQLVTKEEVYSKTERLKRALLGTAAVILTLGIAFFASQSVRDLLYKSKKTIQVKIPFNPSKAQSSNPSEKHEKIESKQKDQKQIEPFPGDKVNLLCEQWMLLFNKEFKPNEISTTNFDEIYKNDVEQDSAENKAISDIFHLLWEFETDPEIPSWEGKLPSEPWVNTSPDKDGCMKFENLKEYSGYSYKFATLVPSKGNPASHFLSASKSKEMQDIIKKEKLDELEVIDQSLVAIKSKEDIKKEFECYQPYYFVVKSKKLELLGKHETISQLSMYSQDKQIKIAMQLMKLICLSRIGPLDFSKLRINRESGKLVVCFAETLHGSLFIEEKANNPKQYIRSNHFKRLCSNEKVLKESLESFKVNSGELPAFQKVCEAMLSVL